MTGLFIAVDRLDAAVVAQTDTRQCLTTEHGMPLHFLRYPVDNAARGKRFAAMNTTKGLLFVEHAHAVALGCVIQKTR